MASHKRTPANPRPDDGSGSREFPPLGTGIQRVTRDAPPAMAGGEGRQPVPQTQKGTKQSMAEAGTPVQPVTPVPPSQHDDNSRRAVLDADLISRADLLAALQAQRRCLERSRLIRSAASL